MTIHKIHTEAEYQDVLKEVSALVDSDSATETPNGKRLNGLVGLVQAYGNHVFACRWCPC